MGDGLQFLFMKTATSWYVLNAPDILPRTKTENKQETF